MSLSPVELGAAVAKFIRLIRARKVDVVHVHHRRLASIVPLVCRPLRVPVVYTGHLAYGGFLGRLNMADAGIAVTESVKGDMRGSGYRGPIHVISNAAQFRTGDAADPKVEPGKYVLCVARLDPVKNHENLLRAWSKAITVARDFKLLLVGEGVLEHQLKALVKELGIENSVEFLGFRNDVLRLIAGAKFLVLTSFVEGQGIVTLEAAGQFRPSLVTNVQGSKDCVPPTARMPNLVDPHDVEDIARQLAYWLTNPEQVKFEGERFYEYWVERARPEVVARLHREVYAGLLTGR